MRYWDASAVVPLLIVEDSTPTARAWLTEDPGIVTWWGTPLECVSALARRQREGGLPEASIIDAVERLEVLAQTWHEVSPTDGVRRTAVRLLRSHPLRAADSLQLAAAIAAADGDPGSMPFVTLDARLADAASKEGFRIG